MNGTTLLDTRLPPDWSWCRIADRYRVTRKPRDLAIASCESVPFVPMNLVPAGGADRVGFEMRPPALIASGTYFERTDVLLAKITPCFENGKQALAHNIPARFGIASTEIIPLQPFNGDSDGRFLFYYLLHPEVRHALASKMEGSTARQRIPEEAVRDFQIPMPPRREQEKIAAVLWKIQRAIEIEEELIATTREFKHAALHQLFSFGLRGEPVKETEIGTVPRSWRLRTLAELREFLQYGTSAKCDYGASGNPVIRIPNVIDGRISGADLKWCQLSSKEIESLLLAAGDVLFIRTNGVRERVGTCAVYQGTPERALFASYLIRARLKANRLDPFYFQYFTATAAGISQLGGRASPAADGKFNVNTKLIDSVLVPTPELEEQRQIAEVLHTIDRKVAVHKRKRATLQDLFKTMLHQLMTAQIRVVNLDVGVTEART